MNTDHRQQSVTYYFDSGQCCGSVSAPPHPVRRLGCSPRPVHVGFMVRKGALGQVFLLSHRFSPIGITPRVLYIHLFVYNGRN